MNIIFVDDDEVTVRLLKGVAAEHDYKDMTIHSATSMAGLISVSSYKWDVVISDYLMPFANGEAIYDMAQELHPESRVIIWTNANVDEVSKLFPRNVIVLGKTKVGPKILLDIATSL